MFLAIDGLLSGLLTVSDTIKASTPAAVATLHREGIRLVMLTGDNERTAATVAQELHLDAYRAGLRPEDKQDEIKRLRGEGRTVAMAGDGINDAAALARADLGIAMASGTGAAIESASIVVPEDRVVAVAEAVDVARRTLRTIRQNLFLAFLYNSIWKIQTHSLVKESFCC